ncbi:MAG: HD domain-containing protein [Gemmataceae bacterium]|nr:HD domain-containing protein [Gemmataceae bacterium]
MAKAPPPVAPLARLMPGDAGTFFAQLAEKSRRQHANKPYYYCVFRAGEASRAAVLWPDSVHFADCEQTWQPGQCYKLFADLVDFEKYGPQLVIHKIRPVRDADRDDGFDPLALVERTRFDPVAMFADLRLVVETIGNEPLRSLVLRVLDSHKDRLLVVPGSDHRYYPFAGGWLEHTLSVVHTCRQLGDKYRAYYPDLVLDMDLLLAGAVLHDVGRVAEFGGLLGNEPTVPGRLLGHITLARDIVREAARDVPGLDPQTLLLLDHLILSHLTLPEWGSPRLPAIPEALILHHADDLDAKMEMYARCLSRDAGPGPFTERDPVLNRPLLKERRVTG